MKDAEAQITQIRTTLSEGDVMGAYDRGEEVRTFNASSMTMASQFLHDSDRCRAGDRDVQDDVYWL